VAGDQSRGSPERDVRDGPLRFTIVAEEIVPGGWHVTVRELPDTWTVAFAKGEVEERARHRIALDLGLDAADIEVTIERSRLHEEPLSHRRN
jgi:hypothetical protein